MAKKGSVHQRILDSLQTELDLTPEQAQRALDIVLLGLRPPGSPNIPDNIWHGVKIKLLEYDQVKRIGEKKDDSKHYGSARWLQLGPSDVIAQGFSLPGNPTTRP